MVNCYCPLANGTIGICGAGSIPCEQSSPGTHNATSGVQLCCASGDQCGANSICQFQNFGPDSPTAGSGFYLGGCTDHTFTDPLCRNDCQSRLGLPTEDIVYVPAWGVWSCCGHDNSSGAIDCSIPLAAESFKVSWTPQQFPGPVDEILSPAITTTPNANSATSTTSSSSTSGISLSITSATPSHTSTNSSSSSLSTGAKAGIGIGAAVGALILLGLIAAAVIFSRRSRRKSNRASAEQHQIMLHEKPADSAVHELFSDSAQEMEAANPKSKLQPAELEQPTIPVELDAQDARSRW